MDWLAAFSSSDDQLAEAAARELAHGGADSLPTVTALLKHTNADVRFWAVRALGEMELPESEAILAGCLQDEDAAVRQGAAVGLRRAPTAAAIQALVRLLDDSDGLTARLAGDALISAGMEAVGALVAVMQGGSLRARQQAARCLAKIGAPETVPILFEGLEDDSAWIRYWADEGLERMGVGMVFFKP